jgi:hypothetical protein
MWILRRIPPGVGRIAACLILFAGERDAMAIAQSSCHAAARALRSAGHRAAQGCAVLRPPRDRQDAERPRRGQPHRRDLHPRHRLRYTNPPFYTHTTPSVTRTPYHLHTPLAPVIVYMICCLGLIRAFFVNLRAKSRSNTQWLGYLIDFIMKRKPHYQPFPARAALCRACAEVCRGGCAHGPRAL